VIAKAIHRPGLYLCTSNRLEILAGKLADVLHSPLPSPLLPDVIVVRNKGMERWLKLELARRHGLCANQRFPFPEAFGQEIFRAVLPQISATDVVDREILTWRVMQALPHLLDHAGFEAVANYFHECKTLASPPDARKCFQLSARIANLFDQYLVYRPEMILDWDAGRDDHWQARLWRAISADLKHLHTAVLWKSFHETLAQPSAVTAALPPRVCIFGVSALPPFYLRLFAALSRHLTVNFFLLQPSQEYWGDITSPREDERILRRHVPPDGDALSVHLEPGNRLLASMGGLGRDFLKLLLDAGDWNSDECFVEPGEGSLLHLIQSDLLHLRDRGAADCPRRILHPSDDSIQVHSCHSPLREMEVLYDQILDWFQRDATLTPRDIVVMTPDIEAYAPFVQAVFGAPEDPSREIPFSLADRRADRQSHIVETFLQILELPQTRVGAATILEFLETEALSAKFGFSEADRTLVRAWVEQAGIRWGIDAEHRTALGLPGLSGNTWRAGLDRLLLGYGMRGDTDQLFAGILPFQAIEGDTAPVLGQFVEFAEALFGTVADLATSRSLKEWVATLNAVLDRFFASTEPAEAELQTIRETLQDLLRQEMLSGFDQPVELAIILERLRPALEDDRFGSGFLIGAVTFCGLKPMRSIPFRIVCLVGMNDGAFPRVTHQLSFDLMARTPRLGDRSTREDDRYLFLETLLSARERLYLSYVGQSVRDNRNAPPSVLVSELLDFVERGFTVSSTDNGLIRDPLLLKHRLQAFHEDYFHPHNRLFSYSVDNHRASESSGKQRNGPAPFIISRLSEAAPDFRKVRLDDLARFLANPAKFFLTRRLGIFLPEHETELEEHEPFVLDGLDGFRLRQELLEQRRADKPLETTAAWAKASSYLPLGAVGEADFRRTEARVQTFYERLNNAGLLDWIEPIEIDLHVSEFQLLGQIAPRTAAGPLLYRCAKLKAREVMRAWVYHLAANTVNPVSRTTLATEGEVRVFEPVARAREELQKLLAHYWTGLREPLKFFPESALAFAEAELTQLDRELNRRNSKSPLDKARERWNGNNHQGIKGETENPYFEFCFRGCDPLDDAFTKLAREILLPPLECQKLERL
jgi:exodeoxyribonuclease V gamma subunit